jgi:hypothetical protein
VLSLKGKVPAVVLEVEASEIAFTKESSLLQLRVDGVHANKIKDKGYVSMEYSNNRDGK